MPRKKTPIDPIAAQLGALSLDELHELQSMIAILIQHREREAGEPEPETDLAGDSGAKQNASGYVEAKTINGYGPYLYLRYRHGGKHHSKYIGKNDAETTE
jgi:hypothetical protein